MGYGVWGLRFLVWGMGFHKWIGFEFHHFFLFPFLFFSCSKAVAVLQTILLANKLAVGYFSFVGVQLGIIEYFLQLFLQLRCNNMFNAFRIIMYVVGGNAHIFG